MKTVMKTKMKKMNNKLAELTALTMMGVALAQTSFAQSITPTGEGSGNSGGGNITEADLRRYMGKLDTFLLSDEGLALFPEVANWNKAHPDENFHQVILNTNPVVQKGELKDEEGNARDCMSYAIPGNRHFVCNSDALPELTLDNQVSFYELVLHELFVQTGIEKPLNKTVRSVYDISHRITQSVHLETYQEWVPGQGEKKYKPQMMSEVGFVCSNHVVQGSDRHSIVFAVEPNGDWVLLKQLMPYFQENYYNSKLMDLFKTETATKIQNAISRKVKVEVLARGKNTDLYFNAQKPTKDELNSSYANTQYLGGDVRFWFRTQVNLKDTTRFTNGTDSEFLGWLAFGQVTKLSTPMNMRCEASGWGFYKSIPLDAIFKRTDKKVFKYDMSIRYLNDYFDKN